MPSMRLVSWNVQRLAADIEAIADEIVRHRAVVVALQEYQPGARGDALDALLASVGFAFRQAEPTAHRFCSVVFATAPAVAMTSPHGLPADTGAATGWRCDAASSGCRASTCP